MTPADFAAAVVRELDALLPAWCRQFFRPVVRHFANYRQAEPVYVVGLRATHAIEVPVGGVLAAAQAVALEDGFTPGPYGIWTTNPGAVAYPVDPDLLASLSEEHAARFVTHTAHALLGVAWLSGILPPHRPQPAPPGPVRRAD